MSEEPAQPVLEQLAQSLLPQPTRNLTSSRTCTLDFANGYLVLGEKEVLALAELLPRVEGLHGLLAGLGRAVCQAIRVRPPCFNSY